MNSPKQIIAVASRYGIVIQHTFSDLYSAIVFLKRGEREGRHLALGAFDPASGVVYALDNCNPAISSTKDQNKNLTCFLELGLKALRIEVY